MKLDLCDFSQMWKFLVLTITEEFLLSNVDLLCEKDAETSSPSMTGVIRQNMLPFSLRSAQYFRALQKTK